MLCEALYLLVTPPDAVQAGQLVIQEEPSQVQQI